VNLASPTLALAAALAAVLWSCGPSEPAAKVFYKKCSACHGMDGRGRTKFAAGRPFADLTDGKWKHGGDRASIRKLVAEGDPGSPMPPFRGRLTPDEIDLSVDYVLRVAGTGGAPASAP
jgi:mono/diheme cytochrome c family protein